MESFNEAEYSETAKRVLGALQPFGIDQANKNPSRLSRLPGALRLLGASGEGYQRLLWLNPRAAALDKIALTYFEESLTLPALEDRPFRRIAHEAMERYQWLSENRGRTGIFTGFGEFDRDSGGLKAGQMTVIAAETNGGKSTVSINIAANALRAGKAVALFSLEMSTEEVTDIVFSMTARVHRSAFNTGDFHPDDMDSLVNKLPEVSALRFWLFDEAGMNVGQIRSRILSLKREFDLDLAIIDYAQIVCPDDSRLVREQQIAGISRAIHAMAKDAKVATIVLSQLNDEGKLRESRVLSHEAHNVVLLENHEGEGYILFRVVKGRSIPKREYRLEYDTRYARVRMGPEPEPESPQPNLPI